MDTTIALESLSNLLTSLSDSPYSLELHAKHMKLASLSELAGQFEGAAQLFIEFYAATDQVWLPFLQKKIERLGIPYGFETTEEPALISLQGIDIQAITDILEWLHKAERDYLSIPIMCLEIKLLVLLHASYVSEVSNRDLEPLLSEDAVRSAIATAVSQASSHLTQTTKGYIPWELQITWELSRLAIKDTGSTERDILRAHVEALHLERLKQPHSTHDQTLQSYSSFVSAYYSSEEYESRLVSASKLRAGPARAWERKERYELSLGNFPSADAYQEYILSERRVKIPSQSLCNALHERAINDFAKRRWEALVNDSNSHSLNELEDALRSFWCSYIDSMRTGDNVQPGMMTVIRRAVRSVPGSGGVWSRYIRALERLEDDSQNSETDEGDQPSESVADVHARALSTSLLQPRVEHIIPIVLARAGYEKRHLRDEEGFQALVMVLEDGISMVRGASKEGDPRLTLEKYLAGIYTNLETPLVEQALALWQNTAKYYKTSSLAWSKCLELLVTEHEYTRARSLFLDISGKKIDWPEAIWQLWTEFEQLHGSVQDIEHCLDKVNDLSAKLEKKRAQEVAKAQNAWMESSRITIEPPEALADVVPKPVAMDSDPPHPDRKRKLDEPENSVSFKRVKVDDKTNLKRDRENSTVFVSGLVVGTTDDDLVSLFRDCGKIREVRITNLAKSSVATVEFSERDSVPAALTKDMKRVRGEEINVHLAWQSTLYVTNFLENTDDATIRELFGHHGEIFDVRWPSKKYKSTRRFCYVQYTSPSAARAALSLHGHEFEPGHNLTVYISNPERKQERSDASANAREIYVAGLSKSTIESDLRKLFEQFGTIKSIRLMVDDKGTVKGFAFVEFNDEGSATAALAANNQELKKRRIAVTLADSRVTPRQRGETATSSQARRSRTLRVKNLPPGTQEGLLQQTLEKRANISRIEIFTSKNEAIVEFANVAEAGRLLLQPEPIIFGDQQLELIEEDLPASSRVSVKSRPMFVPRGAGGRPRAGIGSKKTFNTRKVDTSGAASSMSTENINTEKDQDAFRRMLHSNP